MWFDVALCEEYLGMPRAHWELAAKAAEWVDGDILAKDLVRTALDALARGVDDDAGQACKMLKAHAARFNPALAEGMPPLVFALALPRTLAALRAAGVPEAIIRDTVSDYGIWARSYEKQTGKAGFGEFFWEFGFHSGRLTKLGRLQFETCTFHAPYTIYRHRGTGALVPVPHENLGIDANGFLAEDGPAVFRTQLAVSGGRLVCNAVDVARARILPTPAEYDLADLEPILTSGAQVLHIHIPETGPLSEAEVAASLAQAKAYFAAKGFPCRVAVCESWLMDAALQQYGAGGNIAAFQNRFTLFPWPTDGSDAVNRVFGRGTDATNPDTLPESTRLQRGLKTYLKTGLPLRDAGGVLEL